MVEMCVTYESSWWLKKTLSGEVKHVICIGMFRNRAISKLQNASPKKKTCTKGQLVLNT